ncbi:lipase [Thalassotalea sp. LPB0316]|uniref:VolA/Pla-1 family phospholipase n=1 Tax=Thalassotalea sp. LPB0316 TaxID=2769490 RepID=UPI001867D803|nr:VolA/Pla-1 family phospholipase [Thalassotalea sp. LPB0316]QOL24638.1 lipase [Thalassotalea sp. LPB0316]
MKKLVLSIAITSALGLAGCGGDETISRVQENLENNGTTVLPASRVVFDPSNGVLSIPNDLLFSGTVDGTLNLPVDDPTDFGDPTVALSALDGWSTVNPFTIAINFQSGVSLDADSVTPTSVRVFETVMGGPVQNPGFEDCAAVPQGAACTVVGELQFGVDFVAQASGDNIAIVPIKPLKGKTSYIVALTNELTDSNGNAVLGSPTYELVKQDLATKPLGSEAQRSLQGVVNSYEAAIGQAGADTENVIYTMAMTTQSTVDVLGSLKALMAQQFAAEAAAMVPPSLSITNVMDTTLSVADVLAGQIPPEAVPLYSSANLYSATINLPYYLGTPSAENPMAPVTDWWKALCDSGAMLAGLAAQNPDAIPADPVDAIDGQCMAISQASGLPAPGLRNLGIDEERNLTKFNPVPAPTSTQTVYIQMTTPDVTVANMVRASLGLPAISMPAAGWPVAILQHGITSKKEDMLAITGALSIQGIATVAINHPLHGDPALGGSRGFDVNPMVPGDEINATTVSATHYMNLASLLTTRDNLRQSVVDTLGLRLGLNTLPGFIDGSNVTYLGHSLGAITGTNFTALANAPLNPQIDALFAVSASSLAMPGSGVANFLLESPSFSGLIKASLTLELSEDFAALVGATYPDGPSEAELVGLYTQFYEALTAEQQAELDGGFAQFTFAAQTVTDAGDPANYAELLAATQTPIHLIEVVGDGVDNLPDQVIPNRVSTTPIGGTEGLIMLLGLDNAGDNITDLPAEVGGGMGVMGSSAVRFTEGSHSSVLSPASSPAATSEMQTQVATFFATMGALFKVTNEDVIQ